MFEKKIIKNLGYPKGFFGLVVGQQFRRNIKEYLTAFPFLEISNEMKILDIGCGPAYGINALASLYPKLNIDGIDYSKLMCKMAKWNIRKNKNIKIMHGNFLTININDDMYNRILILNVIYFWKNLDSNMEKLYRILISGGKILIGMASPELIRNGLENEKGLFNLHEIKDVEFSLRKVGFDVKINEDKVIKGSYYIIGIKH